MAHVNVGWPGVGFAVIPLLVEAAVSLSTGLGLHTSLFIGALRCVAQLSVLAAVLHLVLDQNKPALTFGISLVMLAFGATELTFMRLRRRPSGLVGVETDSDGNTLSMAYQFWKTFLALVMSILPLAMYGSSLGMSGDVPWSASTFIPVFGMLSGNAVTGSAVALNQVVIHIIDNSDRIEWKLAYGATRMEASRKVIRDVMQIALLPSITQMSATGIVWVPGAMAGAVLGGQDAAQASRIQMIMLFLIFATAFCCVGFLTLATCLTLLDGAHRVRHDRINAQFAWTENWRHRKPQPAIEDEERVPRDSHNGGFELPVDSASLALVARGLTSPVLKDVVAPLWKDVSLEVQRGELLLLRGPSGCGKTLLLRSLALLTANETTSSLLATYVTQAAQMKGGVPEWRSRVLYVAQKPSTLPSSPSNFVQELSTFKYGRRTSANDTWLGTLSEMQSLAALWQVRTECWDQNWNTLSGGEGQRISLAIALTTAPDVLLLDEPTAALDHAATLLVEESIRSYVAKGGAAICITHSDEQSTRLGGRVHWLGQRSK